MITVRRTLVAFCLVTFASCALLAQGSKSDAPPGAATSALTITMAATGDRARFTAPGAVVRMHVEVYSEAGETLFDGSSKGNVFDWSLADSAGHRVPDGTYLCVVTAKTLSGKLSQRIGQVAVQGQQVTVSGAQASQFSVAQQQAVGPVEEHAALTVLAEGDAPATTVVTHDGRNGQVTSTQGALTFRTGDVFNGKDSEGMRLTEDGNLGIGTDNPQARLDVNGVIRAREGFQFADGSLLNLAPKGGGLRVTLPSGANVSVPFAPNAVTGTAHRIPKFAADGSSLLDSALYQDPNNGFIGWGTTTPPHPFSVRRNGATLGVHSIGELFVDRDDRTRSASLTVGTAGTLKWIFGMPFQSDGFQVYDLTNNVSRFFVDPTSGNIGIGTTAPVYKLTVQTATGNYGFAHTDGTITLGSYLGGSSLGGTGGWLGTRSNHNLFFFTNNGQPSMTVDTAGNVGIGTNAPLAGIKLDVVGAARVSPGGGGGAIQFGTPNTESGITISGNASNSRADLRFDGATLKLVAAGSGLVPPNTNGIAIDTGGLVGIGTNTPTGARLQVVGGSGTAVRGESTGADAQGVYAVNPNGFALGVQGNTTQSRDKGGLIKAMIYVKETGAIVRCYNSQLGGSAGSTAPCGISVSRDAVGDYIIDFGFQVSDRFYSLTLDDNDGEFISGTLSTNDTAPFLGANRLRVLVYTVNGTTHYEDTPFTIIVY